VVKGVSRPANCPARSAVPRPNEKDFPENQLAKSGDKVRIIVTDHADPRPVEDILWTDEAYRKVFEEAGLRLRGKYDPLAAGDEPYGWVSEVEIAPWAVYVL